MPFDEAQEVENGGIKLDDLETTLLQALDIQNGITTDDFLNQTEKIDDTVFWNELMANNIQCNLKLAAAKKRVKDERLSEESDDKPDISHLKTNENLDEINIEDLLPNIL